MIRHFDMRCGSILICAHYSVKTLDIVRSTVFLNQDKLLSKSESKFMPNFTKFILHWRKIERISGAFTTQIVDICYKQN